MKVLLRDESGQTLIFVAVSLTCILGFVSTGPIPEARVMSRRLFPKPSRCSL
jgi:hypothetical protein